MTDCANCGRAIPGKRGYSVAAKTLVCDTCGKDRDVKQMLEILSQRTAVTFVDRDGVSKFKFGLGGTIAEVWSDADILKGRRCVKLNN